MPPFDPMPDLAPADTFGAEPVEEVELEFNDDVNIQDTLRRIERMNAMGVRTGQPGRVVGLTDAWRPQWHQTVRDDFPVGMVGADPVATPAEQIVQQERELQPYKLVIIRDYRPDGMEEAETYPFLIRITRGEETVEELIAWDEEEALHLVERTAGRYKSSLMSRYYQRIPEGSFKLNLLGESVQNSIARPRHRLDRRGIRPEEDVINEDGLILDIDANAPEQEPEQPARDTRGRFTGGRHHEGQILRREVRRVTNNAF